MLFTTSVDIQLTLDFRCISTSYWQWSSLIKNTFVYSMKNNFVYSVIDILFPFLGEGCASVWSIESIFYYC